MFTPDGDGLNVVLTIFYQLDTTAFTSFEMTVNRRLGETGEIVYVTKNPNFIWNGTIPGGDMAKPGMYTVGIIFLYYN
ncbi:MAG: hypothetical protein AAFY71_07280 [Bacteroidota bacterium]